MKAVWMGTVGFVSSGTLCYYGSHPIGKYADVKNLIQFIPRAFVFIVILIFYSSLFNFLRRPDTIPLSSHFASGETTGERRDSRTAAKVFRPLTKLGRLPSSKQINSVNPDAPWESLEFVTAGNVRQKTASPTTSYVSHLNATSSIPNGGILVANRPSSPKLGRATGDEKLSFERMSFDRKWSTSSSVPMESPISGFDSQ